MSEQVINTGTLNERVWFGKENLVAKSFEGFRYSCSYNNKFSKKKTKKRGLRVKKKGKEIISYMILAESKIVI